MNYCVIQIKQCRLYAGSNFTPWYDKDLNDGHILYHPNDFYCESIPEKGKRMPMLKLIKMEIPVTFQTEHK